MSDPACSKPSASRKRYFCEHCDEELGKTYKHKQRFYDRKNKRCKEIIQEQPEEPSALFECDPLSHLQCEDVASK